MSAFPVPSRSIVTATLVSVVLRDSKGWPIG